MYYFPSNQQSQQNQLNSTQLSRDSQVYQPNQLNQLNQSNGGYDMAIGSNNNDWSASNQRKLDKNSNVFIPGKQNSYPAQGMGQSQMNSQQISSHPSMSSSTQAPMPRGQQRPQASHEGMIVRADQRRMNEGFVDPRMMSHEPNPGHHNNTEHEVLFQLINNLKDPTKKYECLKDLNNQREHYPAMAPILWYSTGTVAILLHEIINIYQNLSPPTLTQAHSERICNVLGLFQCIALHQQTRPLFIKANMHLYLYPLINKVIKQKPFEHLRVTSLGVIGALVKLEDPETIKSLMQTELIVLCLRIMKKGNELSRTVATFIVQRILLDDHGLIYVCQTEERLFALAQILKDIIEEIAKNPNDERETQRLLRHIIRCLLRLSENPYANQHLAQFVPDCIRGNYAALIQDEQVRKWNANLLRNLRLAA